MLHQALDNWSSGVVAAIDDALKLIRLYKQEGLEAFIDRAYGYAASAYHAVGDTSRGKVYARLVIDPLALNMWRS